MSVPAYIVALRDHVIDQVCYAHLRVLRTGVQPLPRGLLPHRLPPGVQLHGARLVLVAQADAGRRTCVSWPWPSRAHSRSPPSTTGAAAEPRRLETGLLLRDPERGAIPRDASSLRLLNGRDLCEASRRSRLSRAAKGGLSRGGVGLHLLGLDLNFAIALNSDPPVQYRVDSKIARSAAKSWRGYQLWATSLCCSGTE